MAPHTLLRSRRDSLQNERFAWTVCKFWPKSRFNVQVFEKLRFSKTNGSRGQSANFGRNLSSKFKPSKSFDFQKKAVRVNPLQNLGQNAGSRNIHSKSFVFFYKRIAPRAPRWPQEAPQWPRNDPKLPDGSGMALGRPKMAPRWPQDGPRWPEGGGQNLHRVYANRSLLKVEAFRRFEL